jgi:2'-5' RNA ligase
MFVAVDPPEAAVEHLGAVVEALAVSRGNELGRSTRLAARDRWHVTLAFLGDVPAGRADVVVEALLGAVASVDPPGPVSFSGGGTFGRGRFTVLWVGMGGDVPGLRRLAESIRSQLRRRHVWFDGKGFRPHLTLSRPGDRVPADDLAADVAALGSYVGPLWTVDRIHLVASELGPRPRHTVVASVPVAATA